MRIQRKLLSIFFQQCSFIIFFVMMSISDNSFAGNLGWPGDCYKKIYSISAIKCVESGEQPVYPHKTFYMSDDGKIHFTSRVEVASGCYYYIWATSRYYLEERRMWRVEDKELDYALELPKDSSWLIWGSPEERAYRDCDSQAICFQEKATLEKQCGEVGYIFNNESCKGICKDNGFGPPQQCETIE